jgi:hypothetical protein
LAIFSSSQYLSPNISHTAEAVCEALDKIFFTVQSSIFSTLSSSQNALSKAPHATFQTVHSVSNGFNTIFQTSEATLTTHFQAFLKKVQIFFQVEASSSYDS